MSDCRTDAQNYLASHQVMTLSVSTTDHVWASAMFYVNLEFMLYFLSAGRTRHARYIAENPKVAATIQEDYSEWREIKGIQLEGAVRQLTGSDRKKAIALYRDKYPFVATTAGVIGAALAKVNWYQISPSRLYYIDNSRGFGFREEISLHP